MRVRPSPHTPNPPPTVISVGKHRKSYLPRLPCWRAIQARRLTGMRTRPGGGRALEIINLHAGFSPRRAVGGVICHLTRSGSRATVPLVGWLCRFWFSENYFGRTSRGYKLAMVAYFPLEKTLWVRIPRTSRKVGSYLSDSHGQVLHAG